MNKMCLFLAAVVAAGVFSSCQSSTYSTYRTAPVIETNLVEMNHEAGSNLIKDASVELDQSKLIIVASFVNIDDLYDSSSFGRIASQQVATQFTRNGYHVIEMLLRKDVYIKEHQGEFLLSRRLRDIGTSQNAQAVLVGTYAVGGTHVYVTTKVIDTWNNKTIASYDYKLPLDKDIRELLERNTEK